MGMGTTRRFDDLGLGRTGTAQPDVRRDGLVEQDGFLGHDRNMFPQIARQHVTDVSVTNPDRTALRVIKS